MNVAGAADTLKSVMAKAVAARQEERVNVLNVSKKEEKLSERPATLKNFSREAQEVIKKAEADKAAHNKIQAGIDRIKGKKTDASDTDKNASSLIIDAINAPKVEINPVVYPISNGDDIVETMDAYEVEALTRQEIADFMVKIVKDAGLRSFTSSWLEPERVEAFNQAYGNGTLEFWSAAEIPNAKSYITHRFVYWEQGSFSSLSIKNEQLEDDLGQYTHFMNSRETGIIFMSWNRKATDTVV